MRRFSTIRTIAILFLLVALTSVARDVSAAPKCDPRPEAAPDLPEVVNIVDGEVVDASTFSKLRKEDVSYVKIICWQAAERLFGVRVRRGAVLVFTRYGPAAAATRNLTRLVAAQDAYFRRHGTHAGDISSLEAYEPPPATDVQLTLTEGGWGARMRHLFVRQLCYIFVGSTPETWKPELGPSELELREGKPACASRIKGRLQRIVARPEGP